MTFVPGSQGAEAREQGGIGPSAPALSRSLAQHIWLTPVAVVSGAIASSAIATDNSQLSVAMAVLLALAWMVIWSVVAGMNWTPALTSWRGWTKGLPIRAVPYTQLGSDAAKAAAATGQFRTWLNEAFLPQHGIAAGAVLAAVVIAIVLAAALGAQAVLLTILAMCLTQIAAVASRGAGSPHAILRGLMTVGLPLALGYAAFAPLTLELAATAVGLSVAFAGVVDGRAPLRHIGYGIVLACMLVARQPIGAFLVAVLWAAQAFAQPARGNSAGASAGGRGWLVVSMLAAAVAFTQ
jgi:hypothetical protein